MKLDYDEELGLLHRMYGSMEAEFEVKRAELKKVTGPIKVHVDNTGIMDGLWREKKKKVL